VVGSVLVAGDMVLGMENDPSPQGANSSFQEALAQPVAETLVATRKKKLAARRQSDAVSATGSVLPL
jgi:hypothetical protein